MNVLRPLPWLATALLASCAAPQIEVKRAEAVKPDQHPSRPLFDWHGDDVPGPVSINISLSEQKAHIFRDGREVAWTYVATGRSGFASPRGNFSVLEKIVDKHSNKYGVVVDASGDIVNGNATAGVSRIPPGGRFMGAPMPYWMRITSWGVGMHAGPIPDPGFPASHGCIRFPEEMARKLFGLVKVGTPVHIQ
ncbi:MAG: L,D-transpeptidase family protein [Verrucomicrobiaceae bacterium]|nr:L,D-transpeptidase family protein [Verrucomicrobiaceae bacterium]